MGLGVEIVEEIFEFRVWVAPGCIPTRLRVTTNFSIARLLRISGILEY